MAKRTIAGSIASNSNADLAGGKYAAFTVTGDTGPVPTGQVASAYFAVGPIKSYVTTARLHVKFDSPDAVSAGYTGALSGNSSSHTEEANLSGLQASLLTASPSTIYVYIESTSGSGNKVNFRTGCTVLLEIEYTLPPSKCVPPSGVNLSSNVSTGANVTLSWNSGASGANNAASYYQIARRESTDGSTWGDLVSVTTTGNLACDVAPPSTPGNYYLYYVRLVGAAGEAYASDWVQCSSTLRNPPIERCVAPGNVALSASASHGENVTLSWNAGGGGTHNAASHYEIGRAESADGITWGGLVSVTTTTALSLAVPPPAMYGHHYQYFVRTVGTAGSGYASDWVASGTLRKARPALVTYTETVIQAGVTTIKAQHMQELQTNVNRLRNGLGLVSYPFSTITAGYTSLGGWSTHVAELRDAIDGMAVSHEAWISISVNCPSAAVMEQLRRVVAAI